MPFQYEGILKLREKLEMSRADLAKALQVRENTIYRWETGEATPSAVHLGALFDVALQRDADHPFYQAPGALDPTLIRVTSIFQVEHNLRPDRILVVSDTLRVPDKFGSEVTVENLKRGTQYLFIVPGKNAARIKEEFEPWINGVIERVCKSSPSAAESGRVVRFAELGDGWDFFPAIFYRYSSEEEPLAKRVVGLLGDEMCAPLSTGYVTLTQIAGKSLLKHVQGLVDAESQEFFKQFLHPAHFDESVAIRRR